MNLTTKENLKENADGFIKCGCSKRTSLVINPPPPLSPILV